MYNIWWTLWHHCRWSANNNICYCGWLVSITHYIISVMCYIMFWVIVCRCEMLFAVLSSFVCLSINVCICVSVWQPVLFIRVVPFLSPLLYMYMSSYSVFPTQWLVLCARGPVYCVSVHPSGKVALSVGRDRVMRWARYTLLSGLAGVGMSLLPPQSLEPGHWLRGIQTEASWRYVIALEY